jgi:hypothetical protein
MNLDENKLYMKIVAFDKIYDFLFKFFNLKSSSNSNNQYSIQILHVILHLGPTAIIWW